MRLWITTGTYVLVSIICAFVFPRIERAYFPAEFQGVSVSSAQAFLSAVSSGMMALTGIVFSLAFVIIQFAGAAYSPRLVSWFARDPLIYHSLGMFIATFTYALATLAWTNREGDSQVPLYSTLLVFVLLAASMFLLARLVSRVSELQITSVLPFVGRQGRTAIDGLPPLGSDCDARLLNNLAPTLPPAATRHDIRYTGKPRCITNIDLVTLVREAERAGATFAVNCAIGDTLTAATMILSVYGASNRFEEQRLMSAFTLNRERLFAHDPAYAFRILVDIAIKALSPAVNDPTTAVQAIDQIEDLLYRLSLRELGSGYVKDNTNTLRIVYPTPTWNDYLALAFDEIRNCGSGQLQVLRRLRAALSSLQESIEVPQRTAAVRAYFVRLDESLQRSELDETDRASARDQDRQGLGLTRSA